MTGSVLKLGFLFLYGLMTGTNKCKILSNDDSMTTATLLTLMCRDYRQRNFLSSILNLMIRNPHLANKLPQYRDRRKYKNEKVNGWPDEKEPISPIAELFDSLLPMLVMEIGSIKMPPEDYPRHPSTHLCLAVTAIIHCFCCVCCDYADPRPSVVVKREGERDWVIPVLSDFACGERVMSVIDPDKLGLGQEALGLDAKELHAFSSSPLFGISLEKYVTFLTRAERSLYPVSEQLPFDVTKHGQARSEVAKSMIARLHSDMKVFAEQENKGKAPRLVKMLDADIRKYVALHSSDAKAAAEAKGGAADLDATIKHVEELIELLSALRDTDNQYVLDAIPYITTTANAVRLPAAAADGKDNKDGKVEADAVARYTFLLNRYCGQDTILWLDYLIGSLLSSKAEYDLKKLNPYFETPNIKNMFDVIVGVILHANRVSQTNRSISDAKDVLSLLRKCQSARAANASVDANLQVGLLQKSESLAKVRSLSVCYALCSTHSIPSFGFA